MSSTANPYHNAILYAIGKAISNGIFNTFWRRRVKGRENIPAQGRGTIFAANHRSLADPNLVGSAVPYPIHYFAKEELFQIPLVGWYIRRVNAFPVRRKEHDVTAFKTAQRVLQAGEAILIFPEGGRRLDPARQWKVKAGIGMLSCLTGAQIVPVAVVHSDRFNRLAKITVSFGKPIFPPDDCKKDDYQRLSEEVIKRVKELYDECL
jgi:1-acyl-sn-glycerol-3-phosphate acyltransferase